MIFRRSVLYFVHTDSLRSSHSKLDVFHECLNHRLLHPCFCWGLWVEKKDFMYVYILLYWSSFDVSALGLFSFASLASSSAYFPEIRERNKTNVPPTLDIIYQTHFFLNANGGQKSCPNKIFRYRRELSSGCHSCGCYEGYPIRQGDCARSS